MLALLLACHPSSSPSDDDSASSDTGLYEFDPETDLEWHLIDGTDGDCGTAWPLHGSWPYQPTSEWPKKTFVIGAWNVTPALEGRSDVWDMSLIIHVVDQSPSNKSTRFAGGVWRAQCDGGAVLLLGLLLGGYNWEQTGSRVNVAYAASFASPIEVRLGDTSFDVVGEFWRQEYGEWPPAEVNPSMSFTGTIHDVGTETISTTGGKSEAHHLWVDTDSQMFIDVFPGHLWLSESLGLVQFDGPIGGTFVLAK